MTTDTMTSYAKMRLRLLSTLVAVASKMPGTEGIEFAAASYLFPQLPDDPKFKASIEKYRALDPNFVAAVEAFPTRAEDVPAYRESLKRLAHEIRGLLEAALAEAAAP